MACEHLTEASYDGRVVWAIVRALRQYGNSWSVNLDNSYGMSRFFIITMTEALSLRRQVVDVTDQYRRKLIAMLYLLIFSLYHI